MQAATEEDWETEYLDLILSVRVVNDHEQAVYHINIYGSGHSAAVASEEKEVQEHFGKTVDSAAVYINASTRFTDGAEFGLGAEIGIGTERLHARGPVALEEVPSYTHVIDGKRQIAPQ